MTKFKVETTLEKMMGKSWSYNGKEHRFLRFRLEENSFVIVTDKSDMDVDNENADTFFSNCLPIAEETGVVTSRPSVPQTTIQQTGSKLSEIILDNIERVRADATYIPQASAINEQLKSMIDLGKAEIEMMKLQVMIGKVS